MRMAPVLFLALIMLSVLACAPPALAEDDPAFELRLMNELRALSPAAADTFRNANVARQAEHHQEAAAGYARVRYMVPGYAPAWRREGYELLALGQRPQAIQRMRQALALQDSSWNMLGLAVALVAQPTPSPTEMDEAVGLIKRAETLNQDPSLSMFACQLAMRTDDSAWLQAEVERFLHIAPQHPFAHTFAAIQLASTGKWRDGLRELKVARSLGLPQSTYRMIERQMVPMSYRVSKVGGIVLALWIAGLVLLGSLGTVLSEAALRASRRLPQNAGGGAVGLDAALRKAYRLLLGACCAYYFVSLPIVLGCVLVLGGGLVYLLISTGTIPVKLVLIIAVMVLVTLWAVLKSLFIRVRDEDPGFKLNTAEHPRLRRVLDEVAAKIETRPVTNVYITPGTDLAVMERGGILRQMRGHSERCLILGLGAIEGMRMRPFRAILAHEYGHFSNRDTAGGGFALAVRRSMVTTAMRLAQGGAATWYNPAWLFVNGFYKIFLRVSQGASRLQEVLADRWAAFAYGSRAFAAGLRHVIERSIRFDAHVNSVVNEVVTGSQPLANLYAAQPAATPSGEAVAAAIEKAMNAAPSPYDSHPRPVDRIAWVSAISTGADQPLADDENEVWALFGGREELEKRMTEEVRRNINESHGILLPRDEAELVEWRRAREGDPQKGQSASTG